LPGSRELARRRRDGRFGGALDGHFFSLRCRRLGPHSWFSGFREIRARTFGWDSTSAFCRTGHPWPRRQQIGQLVQQVGFEPAIRSQQLISRMRWSRIRVPGRHLRVHPHHRSARRSRAHLHGRLVISPFVLAQRMVARQGESFQYRQPSTQGRLQILQRFLHRAFRLAVGALIRSCLRTRLRLSALRRDASLRFRGPPGSQKAGG